MPAPDVDSSTVEPPRPGLVGLLIRFALGTVLVAFLGVQAVRDTPSYFDGYSKPTGALVSVILLTFVSKGVVNGLVRRPWGWRAPAALLLGLGIAMVVGALRGNAFGPAFGVYLWVWTILAAFLLGPAFLLAVALRTPGCEMRAYAHLWTKIRGGDTDFGACPGWVDRFDDVRIFGRW